MCLDRGWRVWRPEEVEGELPACEERARLLRAIGQCARLPRPRCNLLSEPREIPPQRPILSIRQCLQEFRFSERGYLLFWRVPRKQSSQVKPEKPLAHRASAQSRRKCEFRMRPGVVPSGKGCADLEWQSHRRK